MYIWVKKLINQINLTRCWVDLDVSTVSSWQLVDGINGLAMISTHNRVKEHHCTEAWTETETCSSKTAILSLHWENLASFEQGQELN